MMIARADADKLDSAVGGDLERSSGTESVPVRDAFCLRRDTSGPVS